MAVPPTESATISRSTDPYEDAYIFTSALHEIPNEVDNMLLKVGALSSNTTSAKLTYSKPEDYGASSRIALFATSMDEKFGFFCTDYDDAMGSDGMDPDCYCGRIGS